MIWYSNRHRHGREGGRERGREGGREGESERERERERETWIVLPLLAVSTSKFS
jgi:hypothetical protein